MGGEDSGVQQVLAVGGCVNNPRGRFGRLLLAVIQKQRSLFHACSLRFSCREKAGSEQQLLRFGAGGCGRSLMPLNVRTALDTGLRKTSDMQNSVISEI